MPDDAHPKVPSLARNFLSSIGLVIALIALINIAFLIFADVGSAHANPYVGIFAYVLLPGVLIFGLALFFGGMLLERRRRRRHRPEEITEYPDINLNNPRTRHIVEWTVIGISVFMLCAGVHMNSRARSLASALSSGIFQALRSRKLVGWMKNSAARGFGFAA